MQQLMTLIYSSLSFMNSKSSIVPNPFKLFKVTDWFPKDLQWTLHHFRTHWCHCFL